MNKKSNILILLIFLLSIEQITGQVNKDSELSKGLILTSEGITQIKKNLGTVPLFDNSLQDVKEEVDAEIKIGIQVPIPKDMAGGFTHERHKNNFFIAQKAGVLFQVLGDEKYSNFVKDMLMEYAKIYPKLPLHPEDRSYSRGKIFWQSLNDANWLVYMSQAYAGIYSWLSKEERDHLEQDLFRPFADFLSIENPQFFNRIHNHSTWGNAAVGMIGLVMNDEELVQRALYGLEEDNIKEGAKDDDGGFIKQPGQDAGFIANIDQAFSPTGYYTEGPYYQRYAMYPYMIFAEALQNKRPELNIFQYRDRVLIKAVDALLNLTDTDGEFFPINDAQKGMSYHSRELISAVDIAYHFGDKDPSLLSIAKKQNRVSLDDKGMSVALAIRNNEEKPFVKKSMELTDGQDGKKGGLAIIRSKNEADILTLVMKYPTQGDSHGHYDKLSFSLYNNGDEIIQDYGLARFVNIDQKNGGGYLKENTSWAKQTIAHNTIVQNENSHFNGNFEIGAKFHSEKHFLDFSRPEFQIISAKENNAYPGTNMHRTMAVIQSPVSEQPLVVDIFKLSFEKQNKYDLPYYYLGQIIEANFEYNSPEILEKLGANNGYQHLWKEGIGSNEKPNTKFTWLADNKFYTLTSITDKNDSLIFARLGATDPLFNL